jgi:hypothetical protein
VAPALRYGEELTAVVHSGLELSSSDPVTVTEVGELAVPAFAGSVHYGAPAVDVTGVVPGATVDLFVGDRWEAWVITAVGTAQLVLLSPVQPGWSGQVRQRIGADISEWSTAVGGASEPPRILTEQLPPATPGDQYSVQLRAAGQQRDGRHHWRLGPDADALPSGLTLWPSGLIHGTPEPQAGGRTYPLVIQLEDGVNRAGPTSRQFVLAINSIGGQAPAPAAPPVAAAVPVAATGQVLTLIPAFDGPPGAELVLDECHFELRSPGATTQQAEPDPYLRNAKVAAEDDYVGRWTVDVRLTVRLPAGGAAGEVTVEESATGELNWAEGRNPIGRATLVCTTPSAGGPPNRHITWAGAVAAT